MRPSVVMLAFAVTLAACGGIVRENGGAAGSVGSTGGTGEDEAMGGLGGTPGTGGVGGTPGTGGVGGTPGTGGFGGTVDSCPQLAGAAMEWLPEHFCIDTHEVTRADYAEWLSTSPSMSDQHERCGWNHTFNPDVACESEYRVNGQLCASGECPNAPQTCVDWCDAYAYCKGVGKHLCGHRDGGPVDPDTGFVDGLGSAWWIACAGGGWHPYPYGDSYQKDFCHTGDNPANGLTDVKSFPLCETISPGHTNLFDMSGNAAEWEDACHPNPNPDSDGSEDECRVRGGSATQSGEEVSCAADEFATRDALTAGIRCCYP